MLAKKNLANIFFGPKRNLDEKNFGQKLIQVKIMWVGKKLCEKKFE